MANEQTRGTTDFATQNTDNEGNVKSRAREAVSQAKERAGERIESRIVESKTRAADTLSGVASTLLSSSQQLREQQHDGASRAIERAAEGVERFASYLQETDVDDVVEQVHEFARRQPAAFIGGAFALGFIASRFLKASAPYNNRRLPVPTDTGRTYQGYSTSRSYERGYQADYENELGRSSTGRSDGLGSAGDTSGTLGYGAGLSTGAGGTTGGGYSTTGGAGTTGASRTGVNSGESGRTGGSDAGSR